MFRKTTGMLVVASLLVGASFAARPLFTDDCGTMDLGKSGFEIGYDSAQTMGFVVKHSPMKNVECSAAYNLPSGTSFAVDQVEVGAKILLAEGSDGVGYTTSIKYNNATKLGSLTAIVSKSDEKYCLDANVAYVPNASLSFLFAAEYHVSDALEVVAELTRTNVDWAGLLGGRCHVNDSIMLDLAYTMPVTSGAPASTTIVGMSVEL